MSLPATWFPLPNMDTAGDQGPHPAARADVQVRGVLRRGQPEHRPVRPHDAGRVQRRDLPHLPQATAAPSEPRPSQTLCGRSRAAALQTPLFAWQIVPARKSRPAAPRRSVRGRLLPATSMHSKTPYAFSFLGDTHIVIDARNTASACSSFTTTWTLYSPGADQSGVDSGVAMATKPVVAFLRYSTAIPFGIQRCVDGTVTSVIVPPASSAMLHMAMACTVPRWLSTERRFRIRTLQNSGRSSSNRGRMLLK